MVCSLAKLFQALSCYACTPPLVAIATVPPRGNQECANEVYRKAISLACPLGKVPSEARRKGVARGLCGVAIDISRCNPSVCSQSSQPPSLSGKIYQTCGRLIFANLFNFYMLPYMLPARELASPQAMTEGCATSRYCRAHLNGRGKRGHPIRLSEPTMDFSIILQKTNLYFRIFLTLSVILYMYTAGTDCIK